MLDQSKSPKALFAGITFLFSFLIYFSTMAPTTSFWDCGEFIACSYTLGIPHPPGSPLYILVGRIFSMLPIDQILALFMSQEEVALWMPFGREIGFRVNLMSPILSAFSAMFTFLIIVRFLEMMQGKAETWEQRLVQYIGGLVGALAFAFSDSQWFNSVEAEVYAASLFFTAIVVWLILRWADRQERPDSDKYIVLIFYFIGLALGVHLLNVLALPTIFLIMYFQRREIDWQSFFMFAGLGLLAFFAIYPGVVKGIPNLIRVSSFTAVGVLLIMLVLVTRYAIRRRNRTASLVLISLLMVIVGYSSYTAIYIRSSLNPVIDENDPDTPERFVKYLNREQYGDWSIFDRAESLRRSENVQLYTTNPENPAPAEVRRFFWDYQVRKMYIRYFGWQFIGKGTAKGPDGLLADTISFRGLLGIPFLLGLLGMIHHFMRDWRRASSVLVLFIMTGIAIVVYLNQTDPQPRERDYAYTGSFFAFAIWIGIGVSYLLELARQVFSEQQGMRRFALVSLAAITLFACPINMLAFNYHDHSRKGNYVAHDYSRNILETCEPNAILFTNGDNDTFPLWFLQAVYGVRTDVRVVNLSLLNTDWYIKQLRDHDPKVPISLKDEVIDRLQAQLWTEREVTIPVPQEVHDEWVEIVRKVDPTYRPDSTTGVRFTLKPTIFGSGIRVQDIMIHHILVQNRFKRPVYFAVTVAPTNLIGLQEYLRMDGLAFRVLPVRVRQRFIDPEIIERNLFEKYTYRNLNNPEVYYNDNIIALLGNYRSAFMMLMSYYQRHGDKEKALRVLDKLNEVMPEDVIPPPDIQYTLSIGQLYQQLGRPEEFKRRLDWVMDNTDLSPGQKVQFLTLYADLLKDADAAKELALKLAADRETRADAFEFLISRSVLDGKFDESVTYAEQWVALDPGDSNAHRRLEELRQLAAQKANSTKSDSGAQK